MKSNKHYIRSFLTLLLFMCATITFAHDIAVANSDGKTIYYNYSTDGTSVSVTYKGTSYYNSSYDFGEYSGDITIPETITYSGKTYSVTSIGNRAFSWCQLLASVTIPSSVTNIGSYALSNCWNLTSVTIPNSVTIVGSGAFNDCSGLTEIKVADGNNVYDSRNNCNAIIETSTNTLIVGCKNTIIPNSVTSIGSWAFYGCSGLTSVTIPNSVTSIDDGAFAYCSGLTSVTIPNSVTSIGYGAFAYCSGLTSVTIPNSVTSIGGWAFGGCSGLTSVKVMRKEPPTISSFDTFPSYPIIYVPYGSKAKYEAAQYWKDFNIR